MNNSKFVKGWLLAMAILGIACIALALFSTLARRDMRLANYDRQEVESIIYEFIRMNAGLTRFARVHVVTGNPLQYDLYRDYKELFFANKVRMITLGLAQEEVSSFQDLADYTEALARFEYEAFALRAQGHHQEAIDMLFGQEYETLGIRSREVLASFESLVTERIREPLFQAEARMAFFRTLTFVIGGILLILSLVSVAVLLLKKHPTRVFACITVVLACVFVVLNVFLHAEESKVYDTNRRSMSFEATIHEYRRVSLDTVRHSRDYLINNDRASYYAYIEAIAQVDYLTEHFKSYALSEDAMTLLYNIADKTMALVAIEREALEMKETDVDEAIAIIHSPEYAAIGLPRANMVILFATMVRFLFAGELDGYLAIIVLYERLSIAAIVGIFILLAVSMIRGRKILLKVVNSSGNSSGSVVK